MSGRGFTPESEALIDRFMRRAVSQRVFPGAVLWVAREGQICFERAYGLGDLFSHQAVTTDTRFDLASLTKPLATALVVLDLVDDGTLSLEQPLGTLLPAAGQGALARITLRQLLNHTSGLAAWRPYFHTLKRWPPEQRATRLMELLLGEKLEADPGSRFCYSDLGYLLLGELVAVVSGQRLAAYFSKRLLNRLQIADLCFAPRSRPSPFISRQVAATEFCPWRGRLLKGQVHDDNAWILDGVAGHAGLFGTAASVGRLLSALLGAYHGEEAGPLSPAMVRHAWRRDRQTPHGLGFDFPAIKNSSAGGYFSFASVGHLGFTGTSFWVDLPRRITVVLLSNRVHPTRHNNAIQTFRPLLHDALMTALLQG